MQIHLYTHIAGTDAAIIAVAATDTARVADTDTATIADTYTATDTATATFSSEFLQLFVVFLFFF